MTDTKPTPGPWRWAIICGNPRDNYKPKRAGKRTVYDETGMWSDNANRYVFNIECECGCASYIDWPNLKDRELLVAAANACHTLNPTNPQKAAEGIVEAVEALEKIASGEGCYGAQAFEYKKIARAALATIRGEKEKS